MKTNRKYEFIREIYQQGSYLLHRIIAVCNFGNVKKGNLGGWIEKEVNLSHNDIGWVVGEAKVYDTAQICNNAKVFENAKVYDNTEIYNDRYIGDDEEFDR